MLEFSGSHRLNDGKSYRYWLCVCECGALVRLLASALRSDHTQSCGCLQKERASIANTRHGKTRTPEHRIWAKMRQRCHNPKSKDFKNYGGRGITICERWSLFENFLADMGERPAGLMLERINNERGYSPENCKWATRIEQNSNTRQNRYWTFNGRTMTTSQWAQSMGIDDTIFHKRVYRGWGIERILTQPVRASR